MPLKVPLPEYLTKNNGKEWQNYTKYIDSVTESDGLDETASTHINSFQSNIVYIWRVKGKRISNMNIVIKTIFEFTEFTLILLTNEQDKL